LSQATSGPVRASGRPCPADPSPPQQRGSGRTVPPDLLYLALILGLGVSPMRRRDFIALVGSSVAGWPLAARAQQPAIPVIGFLSSASRNHDDVFRLAPFRQGLSEAGYAEGRNVAIEYRGADYQLDRLSALAADLTRRQVSLIAAGGSPTSALAAKSATATIPIVFTNAADPVQIGLVASLNRPGGNVTGFTQLGAELGAKRLGLLRELVPAATSIAVLVNPTRPGVDAQSVQAQEAARTL